MTDIAILDVFSLNGEGGNPCPTVIDAAALSPGEMQAIAKRFGHESGFVIASEDERAAFRFRFFVPNHEMEMCGHATIGALWLLAHRGRLADDGLVRVETLSGLVTGFVGRDQAGAPTVEITQPVGTVTPLGRDAEAPVLAALGLDRSDLLDLPIHNAATARVKTLVPVRDPERLNAITSEMPVVEAACRAIGSTGLYPYSPLTEERDFEARQFPRSSGYPEDAATGIAASALAFGLLNDGLVAPDDRPIRIFQGRAMGSLSRIDVRIGFAGGRPVGCLLGGEVTLRETIRASVAA